MKKNPMTAHRENRSLLIYFSLVLLLSIPLWLIGPIAEQFLPGELPTDLPLSSLMVCCPLIAAVILVRREKGPEGVRTLLWRALDCKSVAAKVWYVPVLFFWPALLAMQQWLLRLRSVSPSDAGLPAVAILASLAIFFIAALGEEVGWQGYAIDLLQSRWGALTASIIVGIVWAVWHLMPFIQMGRTPNWILWQCANLVVARILIVWIYNNTGKSVFATIIFHAMYNVGTVTLPSLGWQYVPSTVLAFTAMVTAIIVLLWGSRTLARFRFARIVGEFMSGATD